jgi:hypothetical protein
VAVNQQQAPEGAEPADPPGAPPADPPGTGPDAGNATGTATGTATGEPTDEVLPSFPEQIASQLGGWQGMIEAAVPIAFFVAVNIAWDLQPALLVSIGVALLIATVRLVQRRPIRYVVNGLFGIGLGAVLAWRSGEARDFYLPGILVSYFYVVLMIGSVLIRHPLVGWLWAVMFAAGRSQWRQDPVLLRTLTWLTLAWAVVWMTKVTVQLVLYLADLEHALGVARIVLGTPVFALMLAITIWTVGRVQRRHPVQV